ncbi:MAG: HNH/ENDO VII family nuclease [bacterium]|jgi:hypothetical protein|nr:HNH/ENDO VII family nuclease [bacterium]
MPIAAIDVDGLEPKPVNPGSFEGDKYVSTHKLPDGYRGWSPPQKDYYYFSGGKNAYGSVEAGWFSRSQYESTIKEIATSYGIALANAEKHPGCYCPKGAMPELGDYFPGIYNLGAGWQDEFGGVLAEAVSSGYNRTINSGSGVLEHSNIVFDAITLIQGGALLKQAFSGLSKFGNPKFWSPKEVLGRRVYQRDDLFDPSFIHPQSKGRTNLELMQDGYAPFGIDGRRIQLHHLNQREPSSMVEVTSTLHKSHPHKLRGKGESFRNDPTLKRQYEKYRSDYWKERAKDF